MLYYVVMLKFLDAYVVQARLAPMFVLVAPVAVTAIAWLPRDALDYVWSALGTLGAVVFLAELGRDLGKRREPVLFRRWGGTPTTLILSHGSTWLDAQTLARYHAKLQGLLPALHLPSGAEEQQDPDGARSTYESCVQYLREATRDHDRFLLVFAENISYGFRRNLWGVRRTGVAVSLVAVGGNAFFMYQQATAGQPVSVGGVIALVLAIILLVLWLVRIRPAWVESAARAYAERLVAACDRL